ncbi:MAG: hypothetical protein ACI87W_003187 [Halieaceae bacterium]|jgi:hypothetical protein
MRKDKAKVLDEQWDDARVASFLELRPGDGGDPDHQLLLRAYQSMRAEDFARFIPLFVAAGRSLMAVDEDGNTLLTLLGEHRYGPDYASILREHGAS